MISSSASVNRDTDASEEFSMLIAVVTANAMVVIKSWEVVHFNWRTWSMCNEFELQKEIKDY